MMKGVRLGVFAAMSVDGYLADSEDGLDFLAQVELQDEDYRYMAFASRVKGYVVGRRPSTSSRPFVEDNFPTRASGPASCSPERHPTTSPPTP